MDAQYFLRGCWENSEKMEAGIKERTIDTLKLIRHLLDFKASPEIMLTMILSAILPGTCCKTLLNKIEQEECYREGNNSETVKLVRVFCEFEPLSPPIRLMLIATAILPEFIGKPFGEQIKRAGETMTPHPDPVTLLQEPSRVQAPAIIS